MHRILASLVFLLLVTQTPLAHAQTPGTLYTIDTSHSLLDFTGQHLGFGRVRGTFNSYAGAIYYPGGDATNLSATVIINVASIDTRNGGRDGILQREFFQVEEFPQIRYQTEEITRTGAGPVATGTLTIRDVSKTVTTPLHVLTLNGTDQFGNRRIALGGSLTIARKDFGVFYRSNNFWDSIVSDSIAIEFEVGGFIFNSLESIFPWRDNQIGTMVLRAYEEGGIEAARAKAWEVWNEQNDEHRLHIGYCPSCGLMHRVGIHLMQQGHLADAEAIYALTAEMYADVADVDDYANMLVGMAEVQLARQNYAAAQASLEQALAKDPFHPGALELQRHLKE